MGQDAYALLWEPEARPGRGRPATLSRERIVAEAVAIADAEGLEKVSMKRIAERLDSGVMSLYRHVPGKDELVALMTEAAVGAPPTLPVDEGWRPALAAWAEATRDYFLAHPWALPLATRDRVIGPNETLWLDRALGTLADLPMTGAERMYAVMTVNGFVRGAVGPAVHQPDKSGAQWFKVLSDPVSRERFPNLIALFADASTSPSMSDRFFGAGLDLIFAGLEQFIESKR